MSAVVGATAIGLLAALAGYLLGFEHGRREERHDQQQRQTRRPHRPPRLVVLDTDRPPLFDIEEHDRTEQLRAARRHLETLDGGDGAA